MILHMDSIGLPFELSTRYKAYLEEPIPPQSKKDAAYIFHQVSPIEMVVALYKEFHGKEPTFHKVQTYYHHGRKHGLIVHAWTNGKCTTWEPEDRFSGAQIFHWDGGVSIYKPVYFKPVSSTSIFFNDVEAAFVYKLFDTKQFIVNSIINQTAYYRSLIVMRELTPARYEVLESQIQEEWVKDIKPILEMSGGLNDMELIKCKRHLRSLASLLRYIATAFSINLVWVLSDKDFISDKKYHIDNCPFDVKDLLKRYVLAYLSICKKDGMRLINATTTKR